MRQANDFFSACFRRCLWPREHRFCTHHVNVYTKYANISHCISNKLKADPYLNLKIEIYKSSCNHNQSVYKADCCRSFVRLHWHFETRIVHTTFPRDCLSSTAILSELMLKKEDVIRILTTLDRFCSIKKRTSAGESRLSQNIFK